MKRFLLEECATARGSGGLAMPGLAAFELDDWCDGLAYCTCYSILSGLESPVANGTTISTLIIDNNWQSIAHNENRGVP